MQILFANITMFRHLKLEVSLEKQKLHDFQIASMKKSPLITKVNRGQEKTSGHLSLSWAEVCTLQTPIYSQIYRPRYLGYIFTMEEHDISTHYWPNAGPASQTVAQHCQLIAGRTPWYKVEVVLTQIQSVHVQPVQVHTCHMCSEVHSQKAVSANFTSKQILCFIFAGRCKHTYAHFMQQVHNFWKTTIHFYILRLWVKPKIGVILHKISVHRTYKIRILN